MGFLTVHCRVLYPPAIAVETMLSAATSLFQGAGISVRLGSLSQLNLPQFNDLQVGNCNGTPTAQMNALYANRFAAISDPVAYFTHSLMPPSEGCASHPVNTPACVVSSIASLWALAHELGHLLGLPHVDDSDNLMTAYGAANITQAPPQLTSEQCSIMAQSPLVYHVDAQTGTMLEFLADHSMTRQKVNALPEGFERTLGKIADSSDTLAASKAAYLAGLSKTPAAIRLAKRKLNDPRHHVRLAAEAGLKASVAKLKNRRVGNAKKARS